MQIKSSSQFFKILLGIIIFGILWRITGVLITSRGVMSSKESFKSETDTNSKITSAEEATKKIIGEWNISEEEKSEVSNWVTNSVIDFSENHKFEMYLTVEYYQYKLSNDVQMRGGGRIGGTWEFTSPELLHLHVDTCSINKTYDATWSKNGYFRDCDYFSNLSYGTISDDSYKLKMTNFDQDLIRISGKNFSTGANLKCAFTRNNKTIPALVH